LLPIFNEYIQFLKDNGVDLVIQEGIYWLDRQIIKAYDKQGNLQKIAKLHIDNELNIKYSEYKQKYNTNQLELWNETIERNKERLNNLEKESIELISEKLDQYQSYQPIILTSSGKDSELTRYLVNKTYNIKLKQNIKPMIIFSNTSLDCADTYKMIKSITDCIVLNPKIGFYQQIKSWGTPSRFSRWCCSLYKEGSTIDYLDKNEKYIFFYGMRNEESSTRSNYQDERFDTGWGKRKWIGILPIRKWTEEEVWLYTLRENIAFNIKYKKGYSRVGCAIACPYYTKSTWVLDKYWYLNMYNRFQNKLKNDFIDRQLWCALNCTIKEYPLCWNGGAIRPEPTEEVIQECAEYKGIEIDVAKKYFNKVCSCGKKITKNDVIAMNMKFLGSNTEQYMCKKCLRKFLNITVDQWNQYISDFKLSGCVLF
jgi:phosphoadenosine phosphosulfate reductase